VLPCTLAYCSWFGHVRRRADYLWCAERAGLLQSRLLVGLLLKRGIESRLAPPSGLQGAVAATTVANLAAIVLLYLFSLWHGMRIDLGTWLATLAPAALCFGPLAALNRIAVLGLGAISRQSAVPSAGKTAVARRVVELCRQVSAWRKTVYHAGRICRPVGPEAVDAAAARSGPPESRSSCGKTF